ncbi:MAG: BaiN/RdsA family NAD(P)/FAD-dependent oxidoreductase [Candidatus Binataceae bacterium]
MTARAQAFDAIIIGAGAAGMMCAIAAGQRGKKVLLLDRAGRAGAKILISGGGRCNFTNLEVTPEHFLSGNPHFCKSALSRYTQHDFIAMVERHRIAYHEKTLGQLFCDGSAREIVAMLLAECAAAGVEIRLGCHVTEVVRAGQFKIESGLGAFAAPVLVLASGGLSIPKMGATGFAYDIARRFGLAIVEPRPGLVPVRVEGDALKFSRALAGVSVDAMVTCRGAGFRENILFTHRGLSGPAILQISSYWLPGDSIDIDLTPEHDAGRFLLDRKRTRPKAELKTVLAEILPNRLADAIGEAGSPGGSIANVPDRQILEIAARLKRWPVRPSATEGWEKAEVTVGGIDTAGLSSRTMEAREVPGLYCIGEAVDVTGWLGGYNFQWAWSSGWCAGQAI